MRTVYLLSIEKLMQPECMERFLPYADQTRQEKVMRCRAAQDRARSLGAGLLLRYAAEHFVRNDEEECTWKMVSLEELERALPFRLNPVYRYGSGGKPYFENIPLFYSISHSGEYAACGISDREIGVDVQKIGKDSIERLAERFYTTQEKEALRTYKGQEKTQQFYRLWAQKESYGKLTGKGVVSALEISPERKAENLGIVFSECDFLTGYTGYACWYKEKREEG